MARSDIPGHTPGQPPAEPPAETPAETPAGRIAGSAPGSQRQPPRGRPRASAWGLIAAWTALPLVVILAVGHAASGARLAEEPEVWVPVAANDAPGSSLAQLALGWGVTRSPTAPAWTGTVTSLPEAPGPVLASGDPVVVIDGITRLAVHSPGAFWRELGPGSDPGADIGWLNSALRELGHAAGPGERLTAASLRGIGQLASRLGAGGGVESFDPAWFIYLPAPAQPRGRPLLAVGRPAPAGGAELFAASRTLDWARLIPEGIEAHGPSEGTAGETSEEGAEETAGDSPEAGDAERPAYPGVELAPGDAVLLSGQEVPVRPDGEVDPEWLPRLSALVTPEATAAVVRVVHARAGGAWAIPAAAIYTVGGADTGAGSGCVLTRSGPVRVEVRGSEGSRAFVDGELSTEARVRLAVPAGERACA